MMTFDEIVRECAGDAPRMRAALQRSLGFPAGFWHPEEIESALDVMRGCLEDLGLGAGEELLPEALVGQLVDGLADIETEADEDAARRRQIGVVARHVNSELARGETGRRLRAFADDGQGCECECECEGWEGDEPVWLLVTAPQREHLLEKRIAWPPVGIEAEYDSDWE